MLDSIKMLLKFTIITIVLCMHIFPLVAKSATNAIDDKSRTDSANESFQYIYAKFQAFERPKSSKLGVCTVIRNEGRYLAEWILYHWILGFDHFFSAIMQALITEKKH